MWPQSNAISAIFRQTSASECVLVTMLAARAQAIKVLKQSHPFVEEGHLLSKLMAYCSKEAHSCVEKAAMISFVKLRILEPDEKCSLRADTLKKVRSDVFFFHSGDPSAPGPMDLSEQKLADVPIKNYRITVNEER